MELEKKHQKEPALQRERRMEKALREEEFPVFQEVATVPGVSFRR